MELPGTRASKISQSFGQRFLRLSVCTSTYIFEKCGPSDDWQLDTEEVTLPAIPVRGHRQHSLKAPPLYQLPRPLPGLCFYESDQSRAELFSVLAK